MPSYTERKIWLNQFSHNSYDYSVAETIVDNAVFVEELEIRNSFAHYFSTLNRYIPTAFYIERALQRTCSPLPPAMYDEIKIKKAGRRKYIRRAEGTAAQPVKSLHYKAQSTGSEGYFANMISKMCERTSSRKKFYLHPDMDTLRTNKVRKIVIVTDFIGSGERMTRMLDSLWRLATFRSWTSSKFIHFEVVCYAHTAQGFDRVKHHSSKPGIQSFWGECPTIWDRFAGQERARVIELCQRYGSFNQNPLGYEKSGALIGFFHSLPNNTVAILRKDFDTKSKVWRKYFPDPYTANHLVNTLSEFARQEKAIYELLGMLPWYEFIVDNKQRYSYWYRLGFVYLLLAKKFSQFNDAISATRLKPYLLSRIFDEAHHNGWVNHRGAITSLGWKVLNQMRYFTNKNAVAHQPALYYYPRQLRAPRGKI